MLPPLQSYTLELDREDAEDTSVRFLAPIMGVVVQVRLWFSTGFLSVCILLLQVELGVVQFLTDITSSCCRGAGGCNLLEHAGSKLPEQNPWGWRAPLCISWLPSHAWSSRSGPSLRF